MPLELPATCDDTILTQSRLSPVARKQTPSFFDFFRIVKERSRSTQTKELSVQP